MQPLPLISESLTGVAFQEGELKKGTRLLAERALAEYYEVSYGTIRHAMQVLRDRGLINPVHGRGTFVA